MRTPGSFILLSIVLAAGNGCGDSDQSGSHDSDVSPATSNDATSYQQLVIKVQEASTTYGSSMMTSASTVADCRRVHDGYDARVRPWVSQLVDTSGRMDRYMDDHGGASLADYDCAAGTMMHELDRHRDAACSTTQSSAYQAEARRHVDAMHGYSEHMLSRCDQMMRGAEAGRWQWSPMMGGCKDWGGCCSGGMHDDCCWDDDRWEDDRGSMGGSRGGCCGG